MEIITNNGPIDPEGRGHQATHFIQACLPGAHTESSPEQHDRLHGRPHEFREGGIISTARNDPGGDQCHGLPADHELLRRTFGAGNYGRCGGGRGLNRALVLLAQRQDGGDGWRQCGPETRLARHRAVDEAQGRGRPGQAADIAGESSTRFDRR